MASDPQPCRASSVLAKSCFSRPPSDLRFCASTISKPLFADVPISRSPDLAVLRPIRVYQWQVFDLPRFPPRLRGEILLFPYPAFPILRFFLICAYLRNLRQTFVLSGFPPRLRASAVKSSRSFLFIRGKLFHHHACPCHVPRRQLDRVRQLSNLPVA
jgi:hypothetical protein